MPERLLHLRPADWILPGLIAGLAVLLYAAGPSAIEALRYEREAILGGQAWRLATGHLVHADAPHLAWNLAGLALVWFLFARDYSVRQWLAILFASTLVIDLGFLLLEPDLAWYVGFSGVLHGCMAAGLVAWLAGGRDLLGVLVAALFVAKLAWEHCVGPLPFTAESMSLPVIYEAHSYGAAGGAVAGAVVRLRRRHMDRSL
ncbi:MAG: rhombosortase [Steroidobacteraceae bacterium]